MSAPAAAPDLGRANGRADTERAPAKISRRALARLVRSLTDLRDARPAEDKAAEAGLGPEPFARLRGTETFREALRAELADRLALEELTAWRALVRHMDEGDVRAADVFFKWSEVRLAAASSDGPWTRVLRECIERLEAEAAGQGT